jgi:molybdopterin synthase catalytic subunit/molybdopterin converting factor small subunit
MRVRLLLFAGLREAIGKKEHLLECDEGAHVSDVLARAGREFPVIESYRGRLVVSLNQERAAEGDAVGDGDEIALLPPMSGGSAGVHLAAKPLSLDDLLAEVSGPDCGGEATFTGRVRNHSRGESIDHLEYEAYEPMAEAEMRKITDEVARRWPDVRIAMAHRIGRLEIGDAAVMIATAAPHRAEALEACRFAIDTLKQTVPIWKKEFGESGATWIEENP